MYIISRFFKDICFIVEHSIYIKFTHTTDTKNIGTFMKLYFNVAAE